MRAVLYVSHGTRVKKGVEQAEAFIQACMARTSAHIQEICFLELVEPGIPDGIERCVSQGATEIIIQPVLLLAAGHVKQDIPEEVSKSAAHYPHVTFIFSEPLGVDPKIIEILSERIWEQAVPSPGESAILLVGRGSSDPATQEDFKKISAGLSAKESLPVYTCFLAACEPSFRDGLEHMVESDYPHIFVVPYLMFTGLLMKEMVEATEHLSRSNQHFYLCDSMGHHENLIHVLAERVATSLKIDKEALS